MKATGGLTTYDHVFCQQAAIITITAAKDSRPLQFLDKGILVGNSVPYVVSVIMWQ